MSTKEINKIKKRREKKKNHEKKTTKSRGRIGYPPLRTLAPPSGHPPRGLAVSCWDILGGVVEWGDGEFREMFFWGPDGHDGHMMVDLVGGGHHDHHGGHMDGGRHSGGGEG